MGYKQTLFLNFITKALLVFLLLEFALMRTLQRVFTPLIFPGTIFLLATLTASLILLLAVGPLTASPILTISTYSAVALATFSIVITNLGDSPPASISIVYYILIPATSLIILYRLVTGGLRLEAFGLAAAVVTAAMHVYSLEATLLASHYEIKIPWSPSLPTIATWLSIILPAILGIIGLRLSGMRPKIMALLLPTLPILPVLLASLASWKVSNYLALYVIEVFGIPVPIRLVPVFLASLWLCFAGLLSSLRAGGRWYALGASMLVLSGYQFNVTYNSLVWLAGAAALCMSEKH